MNEEVDMVGLAVEFAQFGIHLGAHVAHQVLALGAGTW